MGRCPAGAESVRFNPGPRPGRCMTTSTLTSSAPAGDNRFPEDYTAEVRGERSGVVVLVARNAGGEAQQVVVRHRRTQLAAVLLPSGGREGWRRVLHRQRVLTRTYRRRPVGDCSEERTSSCPSRARYSPLRRRPPWPAASARWARFP